MHTRQRRRGLLASTLTIMIIGMTTLTLSLAHLAQVRDLRRTCIAADEVAANQMLIDAMRYAELHHEELDRLEDGVMIALCDPDDIDINSGVANKRLTITRKGPSLVIRAAVVRGGAACLRVTTVR